MQHSIGKTSDIQPIVKDSYDVRIFYPFILVISLNVIVQMPSLPAFAGLTDS